MMHSTPTAAVATTGPRALYNRVATRLAGWIGHDLLALAARFGIAGVFWLSGRTKVEGWLTVSDNAVALFVDEYKVPLLPPGIAAHLAAYSEHLFPILLVLGLATRASALALAGDDCSHPDIRLSGCVADAPRMGDCAAVSRRARGRTLVARCAARAQLIGAEFSSSSTTSNERSQARRLRYAASRWTAARLHALKKCCCATRVTRRPARANKATCRCTACIGRSPAGTRPVREMNLLEGARNDATNGSFRPCAGPDGGHRQSPGPRRHGRRHVQHDLGRWPTRTRTA